MEIKKQESSRNRKQKAISEHHHPGCKSTVKIGKTIAILVIRDVEQLLIYTKSLFKYHCLLGKSLQ
jgi:hypothetical protein